MNIAYLSFRIAGTDGVSLEAERWRTILERMGHKVTFIAGELDQKGILIPQLHFNDPYVYGLHERVITNGTNYEEVEKDIFAVAGKIEGELRDTFRHHKFDLLIQSNVFSLPIHFPLAVALERVINEFQIPTISRNHDFWWERQRYLKSDCFEFFKRFFPPTSSLIKHITINKIAHEEMLKRTGINSAIISDTFDFESKENILDDYSKNFRKDFGIQEDDIVFLQATRIVPRKNIEKSIELIHKLNNQKMVLVMAGYYGDESGGYINHLEDLIKETGIRAMFIGTRIDSHRKIKINTRFYTLWDAFNNCDLSTYPSTFEGFGNQFIEAVYFKKPVFVNRYEVFKTDLEPLGFETIAIDNEITQSTLDQVNDVLNNPEKRTLMVEKNFEIAKENFSYEATQKKIEKLL
jgi:glycosyltransferase involved in cell wall biosynthesis